MTVREAAQKWRMPDKTIYHYASTGRIPGACQPNEYSNAWFIPPDAKKPAKRKRGPKPGFKRRKDAFAPMTAQEQEAHILRFCTLKTYRELCADTGLVVGEVREIYDRLHALHGI